MVLFFRLLWWKWIKRECPHVCAWCIYRCQCWDELFNEPQFYTVRKDIDK